MDRSPGPSAATANPAADVVRLDLAAPPSRAAAGIDDGRDSLILERVGEALDVTITLPEGEVLRVPAVAVNIFTRPGGGPVELVVVNRRLEDAAAVRDALLTDAGSLRLAPADVEAWFARAGGAASSRVLTGSPLGYLVPEVSVRQDPGEGADYLVNYSFSWEPQS